VSTLSDTSRWKVAVDGSERVRRGAGGKYGMKVGTCWSAGRVLKGDESALDGAGRQE
jgi:hypothetical protein